MVKQKKPKVGNRDISSSTPPEWRLPFFLAMSFVGAVAVVWMGIIEVKFRLAEPDKHDADPKWGEEFSLFGNMYECFTSLRGEWILVMALMSFCFCFIVHAITWLLFRAFMSKELYNSCFFHPLFEL